MATKSAQEQSNSDKQEAQEKDNECEEELPRPAELKIEGELISQCAEAKVYKNLIENKETIIKYRFPKKYRHPAVDLKLRKNRTKCEARQLGRCKDNGILAPELYRHDKDNCIVYMEYIDLPQSKIIINNNEIQITKTQKSNCNDNNNNNSNDNSHSNDNSNSNEKKRNNLFSRYDDNVEPLLSNIGNTIALLHFNDMIHGDLTTSNMLYDNKNDQLYMIDFGLSFNSTQAEDKAVDLYVLERAFVSTHAHSKQLVDYLLNIYFEKLKTLYEKSQNDSKNEKSQNKNKNNKARFEKAQQIMTRLEQVRLRGRKRSMIG